MIKTKGCAVCLLILCAFTSSVQAQRLMGEQSPMRSAQHTQTHTPVPGDNTIRRINPNSRQGSVSSAPPVRGPSTLPMTKTPSIEQGGIGNGYPRAVTPPQTLRPTAPSLQRGTQR